jgi:hypothetical protein
MISAEIGSIAAQCRHYAMCKIDFLGTGVCPAGTEHFYASYYPQGRMDLCHALAQGRIPVTAGLVEIAQSCDLCGICDRQCYFVTGLRPLAVMRALKEYAEEYLEKGGEIFQAPDDPVVQGLREIVGLRWATSDPALLAAYASDPCPLYGIVTPRCVVLPGSQEEVSAVVRFLGARGVPYLARGNGSSVMGFVLTEGVVLDLKRMNEIELDPENWSVTLGPGVSAFELQQAAMRSGFRVNVAEPAAMVAANLICSGIFSTFSHAYGTADENFISAEFVRGDGKVFELGTGMIPGLAGPPQTGSSAPSVCTRVTVKLHPVTEDEQGVLVPFPDLDSAVSFARELGRRRIGLAVGVLGDEYLGAFISPARSLVPKIREALTDRLGIGSLVLVIGDRFAIRAVRELAPVVIDSRLFRTLMLSLPSLAGGRWAELLEGFEGVHRPYEVLFREEMYPLLEAILDPSPENAASAVDPDLRDFFAGLYARPEMTDLVWLNMFRIISSRMGRDGHVLACIFYLPLENSGLVEEMSEALGEIARKHGIHGAYGFLTPLDLGRKAVLEYDYYSDHTDPEQRERARRAIFEAGEMIERFCAGHRGVRWIRDLLNRGYCRQESLLYS